MPMIQNRPPVPRKPTTSPEEKATYDDLFKLIVAFRSLLIDLEAYDAITAPEIASIANKVDEAPIDGQQYAREDGAWTVVSGGGGGGGGIVAKARVDFSTSGVMTLTGAQNVTSITRTGAGLYTVNFTSAIPAGCVLKSSCGRFGDNASYEGVLISVSRVAGEGIGTTTAHLIIHASVIPTTTYDPWNGGLPNSWMYFEISDPTVSI